MKADELREKYLTFFESKGCVRRASDLLVPRDDPSVLFTPAGMNQFKDQFLGKVKLEFTRATTCQKCLRTGDIENVGRTAYHHTFFEMLGNFSFGDYFKREAIVWAWEFLTSKKWLGLDADRISVTVYKDDDEAARIWTEEIKLPSSRVVGMDEEENFWPASAPSKGPDGVCGPCSEIYYQSEAGGNVEIWNLVFTQYNRVGAPPNNLRPLPSRNIDTGMGLERAAAVLQKVDSNYHIDIFLPLVEAAAQFCHSNYEPRSDQGRRLRRIADHVRACTFAIHENVLPGPNKEKYVIRRLLRRAVLDGRQLGHREPFLFQLVPVVAQLMHRPYPELGETIQRVQQVIRNEEASFFATLDSGLERIERVFQKMKEQGRSLVSGEEAADMYTTYGFPPEMFETLAAEHNVMFDWDGFRQAMQRHGIESGGGQVADVFSSSVLDPLRKVVGATKFLGYESTEAKAKIVGIVTQDRLCEHADEIGHDRPLTVVLDRTPFYGEAGGQVGDTGDLIAEGLRFEVINTQREGGLILHLGHLKQGALRIDAQVTARVDVARRQAIRRAHSATHMLHYALRRHLGSHAQQQGSKVDADWLRFDFAHPSALSREQLKIIADEVNRRILEADEVRCEQIPLSEARSTGAMMLFGEKYPDVVRVVSMGDFSKELCGGTHLSSTGQVGLFLIIGEESVAAGIRRITALTGMAALARVHEQEDILLKTAAALKIPAGEIPTRVAALAKEVRELRKKRSSSPSTSVSVDSLLAAAIDVGDTKLIVSEVPGGDAVSMRKLFDQLRRKSPKVAAMLAGVADDKIVLIAGRSRDLDQLDSVQWVRAAAKVVGGGGGGRPDLAQAGGKTPEKLSAALEEALTTAQRLLSE